ncbi:hypothetical protein A0H81_10620 [Grifola frondosa]|uniref:DUF6534 domain-containing protein n=1 Tax=Grifola frondosa TaxID=5627 RepID=A0A1C7LZH4_GRIFR|nr:hypothetical protein A0H81_10620 [Grifola frondosa]
MSLAGGGVVVRVIVTNKEDILIALKAAEKPRILQCVTAVLADLYIVVLLCLTLKGSSSGFKRTNRLVNKLIVYTVNRGILTVALQLCSFLTYVVKVNEMDLFGQYFGSLVVKHMSTHYLQSSPRCYHSEALGHLPGFRLPGSQNTFSSSQTHV